MPLGAASLCWCASVAAQRLPVRFTPLHVPPLPSRDGPPVRWHRIPQDACTPQLHSLRLLPVTVCWSAGPPATADRCRGDAASGSGCAGAWRPDSHTRRPAHCPARCAGDWLVVGSCYRLPAAPPVVRCVQVPCQFSGGCATPPAPCNEHVRPLCPIPMPQLCSKGSWLGT